jgi:HAD superfamily hydrolase (TIGR01509 family)
MIGVLVDLDGVLWFSESVHKDAFKMTLAGVIEDSAELVDQTWKFGESTGTYFKRLLKLRNLDSSEPKINELVAIKRKFAAEATHIPLNTSLINSLREVKEQGILLSLVSASSNENVQKFLNSSDLHNFFDCVIDASMTLAPKPDPSCYSLAMNRLGLAPHNCIVIEDSELGRVAAQKAGITQVLIYPTDFPVRELTQTLTTALSKVF